MRLRWPFGVSQPDLEQPERDLLAPVRGSLRALRRAPGPVDGAPASGRRQTPGCAVHREKAVQRSLKGVRRICAGVRAPRARAHQRRPRHHAPNVFTACDQDFHVAGGSHVALLRHHDAQRRRRCNTGTGFRSTCGATTRAKGPGWACERPQTTTATSAWR